MKPLITPSAMRDMEARYFAETGTHSIDLMERAARALCDVIVRRYGANRTAFFACGPGGNGGDGYACARMYLEAGGRAVVVSAAPPSSRDAAENLSRARAAGVREASPDALPGAPDLWVDALYGTGLSRAPSGEAARLIERMNADRARGTAVVAVDIPSGLNGLSGAAFAPCVRADVTCTFQYMKPGCALADGLDFSGDTEVLDIGIPADFYPDGMPALAEAVDAARALPRRPRNFHKGSAGHLLIVAGSLGMAGAAALCARAALRSGVGLVTVGCPASIVPILQTLAPCAMCVPLPEEDGALCDASVDALSAVLPGKTAVACGCGLSTKASPEVVRLLLEAGLPAVFDADALNLAARNPALLAAFRPHHVITPHPGEAARLLGRKAESPVDDARALRSLGCQALLKGAASVVCVGDRPVISISGCDGMAKGGSGDCLTGLLGGLIAQQAARLARAGGGLLSGEALAECAFAASELHGAAGELAQARLGAHGMTAMDLVEALPEVLRRYE